MKYAGIVLILLLAACGDDPLGPADLQDPAALQGELNAVDSAFASEPFASFAAVSVYLGPTPVASTTPMLLAAPGPLASPALRAARLRRLAPSLDASLMRGPIIPDSVYGRVYRWNATTNEYAWNGSETVTGLNGVRFILYRVDDFGTVEEPVVEVGSADLIDQSVTGSVRLRVLVQGTGGTPTTYVDYLATVTETATSATITVTGSITNGLPAAANKTLTFDVGIGANAGGVTFDATFVLDSPDVTIDLREGLTFSQTAVVFSVDFRVIRPSEVVRLVGRMTLEDPDMTIDLEVRVNGGIVASLEGDVETAQWVDAGGEPLGPEDLEALDALFQAFGEFAGIMAHIIEPLGQEQV